MDLTTEVKLFIYRTVADTTRLPNVSEVAQALSRPPEEVQRAFEVLAGQRLLVLQPGDGRRIRMAPPFSGIESPFLVETGGKAYHANCAWDALGVAAALQQDAEVSTSCAHSGQPLTISLRNSTVAAGDCIAHFVVPAALWWQDIIYT